MKLYHATSKENAEKIIESQKMYGKENGLFFSDTPDGEILGYGKTIIEIEISENKIELDDIFGHEKHYRMECIPFKMYPVKAKLFN